MNLSPDEELMGGTGVILNTEGVWYREGKGSSKIIWLYQPSKMEVLFPKITTTGTEID